MPGLWIVHPLFLALALLLMNTQTLRLWWHKRRALAETANA